MRVRFVNGWVIFRPMYDRRVFHVTKEDGYAESNHEKRYVFRSLKGAKEFAEKHEPCAM